MTLDRLYGRGSLKSLRELLPALQGIEPTVSQADTADGGVRLYVTWDLLGQAKLDCYERRMRFLTLRIVVPAQGQGVLTALTSAMGDWAQARGVDCVIVPPADAGSERILRRSGAETIGGELAYRTQGDDQRRLEYAAFKFGLAPEPEWRKVDVWR